MNNAATDQIIIVMTIAPNRTSRDISRYSAEEYEECYSVEQRARLDAGQVVTETGRNGIATQMVNATVLSNQKLAAHSARKG